MEHESTLSVGARQTPKKIIMEASSCQRKEDERREVVLSLDIGSSSVRCSAYSLKDGSLSKLHATSRSISCVRPNSGKIAWHHGDATLLQIIDQCVDETVGQLRRRKAACKILAVGFSSFVMNLVGVDERGAFVDERATMSYACNTAEVAKQCKAARDELGTEGALRLYQTTGAPIHSSYAIAQLRAFYRSSEGLARRIHKWQSIASLCLGRWTDNSTRPISYSEASWTGLLNFKTCQYAEQALSLLAPNCKDALPELGDVISPHTIGIPQHSTNGRTNPFWKKWPELRQSAFFLGVGDGACANVGSKAVSESRVAVTIGTSAAARICLPLTISGRNNFQVPPGLFCYRINSNHVLVGGALTDGGSVVEWAKKLLNLSDEESFLACMKQVEQLSEVDYETKSSNLTMIPFLSGERATGFRGGATGSMIGLTRDTTPAHFLKACLEGVSLRLKDVLQLLVSARSEPCQELPTVVVSGKALEASRIWRQMISDSSGLELVLDSDTLEGTSRGVARILSHSLQTSGMFREEPLRSECTHQPRKRASDYFEQASIAHNEFLQAVSPIYTRNDS